MQKCETFSNAKNLAKIVEDIFPSVQATVLG